MRWKNWRRHSSAMMAAWLLSVSVDLLLHAGVLAWLYTMPSPFLLTARDAALRIPLGYLAFLILTGAVYWLICRARANGASAGFQLGLIAGLVVWGAFLLGLYSISTISPLLALGWWLGQSLELASAAALLGAVENGWSLRRAWGSAVIALLICAILVFGLQSLGWVPVMELTS